MKTRLALAALALTFAPALAFAGGGCKHDRTRITASACGEGMVWDTVAQACVVKPTS
jgi:hypothetical protein